MNIAKTLLWLVVVYEAGVGLSELAWVETGSTSLASVAALPSASSLIDGLINGSTNSNANLIEGGLDVAIALGLWAAFLRG